MSPIQLFVGLFRSPVVSLHPLELEASWEKTGAERVELTVSWDPGRWGR